MNTVGCVISEHATRIATTDLSINHQLNHWVTFFTGKRSRWVLLPVSSWQFHHLSCLEHPLKPKHDNPTTTLFEGRLQGFRSVQQPCEILLEKWVPSLHPGEGVIFKKMDLFGAIHLGLNYSFMSLVFVKFQGLKTWREKVNMRFWEGATPKKKRTWNLKKRPLGFWSKILTSDKPRTFGVPFCFRGG